MNNFKLSLLFLVLISLFITACSDDELRTKVNQLTDGTTNSTQSETAVNNMQEEKSTSENNANVKESTANSNKAETESTSDNYDITPKTKDYIMNGQDNRSEAEKIKWSEAFLNQVSIDDVYQEYLSTGGTADDLQRFAQYLTLNAPIPDNWDDLVAADLLSTYDKEISRFEHLQDDLYQVYVEIDGSEVPFVVVNSRTGYFHG